MTKKEPGPLLIRARLYSAWWWNSFQFIPVSDKGGQPGWERIVTGTHIPEDEIGAYCYQKRDKNHKKKNENSEHHAAHRGSGLHGFADALIGGSRFFDTAGSACTAAAPSPGILLHA